jgi:excisionase family DNA binding protein
VSNEKEILTTFEAARYCHVHPGTIKNWIRNGMLKAFKTPGGHRRIYRSDLDIFLKDMDIPVTREESGRRRKVLVAEPAYRVREAITRLLHRWGGVFEVTAVDNAFEAGEMLVVFKPGIVIIDRAISGMDIEELCTHIKSSAYLDNVRVIVLGGEVESVEESAADAVLERPLDISKLSQAIESILEAKRAV